MYYQPQIDFTAEEVIVYLRKSRSDDPTLTVEEVLSKHESILDEVATRYFGKHVPEVNKYREVVSGETLKERPEIQIILNKMESPRIKAVAVVEPQRLTRGDLEDIGRLMKLLKHTNTLVITQHRIYNLRDEYDWDAFERELKRGNDYLEYTKKILNRGRLLSVSQGNYIGSIPPYGYDKTFVMDGKRKCPTLIENKEQANVVRMIFDMYVNKDMGRTNICHTLDNLKVKPPKGKHWSPYGLKDMLENVHYIGKVKWNWRKTETIVEDSEIIKTRPKSKIGEYLIYEGKHEGIVSEELFYAAREKQGRKHRAKPKTKVRNPLSSLLFCKCGRAMSLRFYKNPEGIERTPPRLLCDGQTHCKSGSVFYTEMIDYVCGILKDCIKDFEIRIQNDEGDSVKLHARLIKDLEKRKKEIQERELLQWEQQSDPNPAKRMPQEIFVQLNEKLLKEKEEIQQALCKAYESMPDPVDYEEKKMMFQEALEALQDDAVPPEIQNRLLKNVIEKMTYTCDSPVRLTKKNCMQFGIQPDSLTTGGNWYTPPFELDVSLKVN